MTKYDNTNSGILSRNDRRESDKHPEFTGTLNVEGTEYRLAAWVRERKDGSGKFFSLKVTPKEERAPKESKTIAELDDDCPF